MVGQSSPVESVRPQLGGTNSPASPEISRPQSAISKSHKAGFQFNSGRDVNGSPFSPVGSTAATGYPLAGSSNSAAGYPNHDSGGYVNGHGGHNSPQSRRQSIQANNGTYGVLSPVSTQHGGYHNQQSHTPHATAAMPYVAPQNFPPFSLPPSDFAAASISNMSQDATHGYEPEAPGDFGDPNQNQSSSDMMLLDQIGAQPTTIPVFGEGFSNKSPYSSIPDDLVAYLFSTNAPDASPTMGHMMSGNQYSR